MRVRGDDKLFVLYKTSQKRVRSEGRVEFILTFPCRNGQQDKQDHKYYERKDKKYGGPLPLVGEVVQLFFWVPLRENSFP